MTKRCIYESCIHTHTHTAFACELCVIIRFTAVFAAVVLITLLLNYDDLHSITHIRIYTIEKKKNTINYNKLCIQRKVIILIQEIYYIYINICDFDCGQN